MGSEASNKFPQLVRGTILDPEPDGGVRCIADGEIVIDGDGVISECRETSTGGAELIDWGGPVLIVPGLVDGHVHLPQYEVRGRQPGPLLDWLRELIFPTETRFADLSHARLGAETFDRALLALGTTAAGIFATVHTAATRSALEQLRVRGLVGKVLMDRGAPAALLEEAAVALPELRQLIADFGGRAAVVPRFAVSCSPELLTAAGRVVADTGAAVMTHLAENLDEVRQVGELFPDASYTEVYDRAGLLGKRSLVAHAVHLAEAEFALLAARGTTVVHCPTANAALGSGRLAIEKLRQHGVPYVLGSDVGAGPSLSMWQVMAGFLVSHAGRATVSPEEAFWCATLGGARALGLTGVGRLVAGQRADLAVFARPPGPAEAGALIRAMTDATADQPEPLALATWLDGRLVHRADHVSCR